MKTSQIISLFISFVMLFNLTSETFAGVIKANSLGKIFEKEKNEITASLNTLNKNQANNNKAHLSLKKRYELALENYVKAGQDYEDFIYSVDGFIIFKEHLQNLQEETNSKGNSLYNAIEQYNQDVEKLNTEVATLEKQQEDYIAWKVLEPMMIERKAEEQRLLKTFGNSEDLNLKKRTKKAQAELYENLKEEISATEDFFKLEGYWKEYEKRWVNADKEENRLSNQYDQNETTYNNLTNFQKTITRDSEKNDEMYNKKIDELFGMDNIDLKVSDQTDLEVFISTTQAKMNDMYEDYLVKKAIYEKVEKQYLDETLNVFEGKVKRFNARIEKKCEEVEKIYDNYGASGGNDRSLMNMYETRMLNACIAPVITPEDFDGTNEKTELTFADFVEMKYNEYSETYNRGKSHVVTDNGIKCNTQQNWVQIKEEKKENGSRRIWCQWKPNKDAIAQNKANNVLGLLLISPTIGTQALVSLEAERMQAIHLNTNREQLLKDLAKKEENVKTDEQDLLDLDIPPIDWDEYAEWEQKDYEEKKEQWRKDITAFLEKDRNDLENARDLASDYLKKISKEEEEEHNSFFRVITSINAKALKLVYAKYGQIMIRVANGENKDKIITSLGLNPDYLRKSVRDIANNMEGANMKGQIAAEINNSKQTYSQAYINKIVSMQEQQNYENRGTLEKVGEVLDWIFIAWPTTVPSMIIESREAKRQHEKAVANYTIENDGVLKNLLRNYVLFIASHDKTTYKVTYPNTHPNWGVRTVSTWGKMAQVLEGKDSLLNYMLSISGPWKLQEEVNFAQKEYNTANAQIAPYLLLVADICLMVLGGAGIVKLPSLLSSTISMARSLRFLSLEQRIMNRAIKVVMQTMKTAELAKYQKSLEILKRGYSIVNVNKTSLTAYLNAQKAVLKTNKEIFQKAIEIAGRGKKMGKVTRRYEKALYNFRNLLKDNAHFMSSLKDIQVKNYEKMINGLKEYNKIVKRITAIQENPVIKEYNRLFEKYTRLSEEMKNAKELDMAEKELTKFEKQNEKELRKLQGEMNKLQGETKKYTNDIKKFNSMQENLQKASRNVTNFFNDLTEANELAKEGKLLHKIKAKQKAKAEERAAKSANNTSPEKTSTNKTKRQRRREHERERANAAQSGKPKEDLPVTDNPYSKGIQELELEKARIESESKQAIEDIRQQRSEKIRLTEEDRARNITLEMKRKEAKVNFDNAEREIRTTAKEQIRAIDEQIMHLKENIPTADNRYAINLSKLLENSKQYEREIERLVKNSNIDKEAAEIGLKKQEIEKLYNTAVEKGLNFQSEANVDNFIKNKSNGKFKNFEEFNKAYSSEEHALHQEAQKLVNDNYEAFSDPEIIISNKTPGFASLDSSKELRIPLRKLMANYSRSETFLYIKPTRNANGKILSFSLGEEHTHKLVLSSYVEKLLKGDVLAVIRKNEHEILVVYDKVAHNQFTIGIIHENPERGVNLLTTNYTTKLELEGFGEQIFNVKDLGGGMKQVIGVNEKAEILFLRDKTILDDISKFQKSVKPGTTYNEWQPKKSVLKGKGKRRKVA